MYSSLDINHTLLSDIPCLLLSEKGRKPKGNIFLYHGWSSKKENYKFIGSTIALAGYQVIIPDSLYHGDRGILDYSDDKVMEEYFWKVAIQSIDEYFMVKNHLEKEKILVSDKMAVMGSSMGGMISAGIFAKDPSLLTMTVMNGSCAWQYMDQKVQKNRGIDRMAWISAERINEYDPVNYLERIYPRPFLLLHGEADQAVPIAGQDYFYEKARQYYGDVAERIRYTKVANLNHHKTTGMLEESINWMNYCFDNLENGRKKK